jgi:hypothetical protein
MEATARIAVCVVSFLASLPGQQAWSDFVRAVNGREEWVRNNNLMFVEVTSERGAPTPFLLDIVLLTAAGTREKWVRYSHRLEGGAAEPKFPAIGSWNAALAMEVQIQALKTALPQISILADGRTLTLSHDRGRLWTGRISQDVDHFPRRGGLVGAYLFGEEWLSAVVRDWGVVTSRMEGDVTVFDLRTAPSSKFVIRLHTRASKGYRLERLEYWVPTRKLSLGTGDIGSLAISASAIQFIEIKGMWFPTEVEVFRSSGAASGNHSRLWIQHSAREAVVDPQAFSLRGLPAELKQFDAGAVIRDDVSLEILSAGNAPGLDDLHALYLQSSFSADQSAPSGGGSMSRMAILAVCAGAALIMLVLWKMAQARIVDRAAKSGRLPK